MDVIPQPGTPTAGMLGPCEQLLGGGEKEAGGGTLTPGISCSIVTLGFTYKTHTQRWNY